MVSYTYDAGANGKGHLTSLTDQAGTGSYVYDPLGRIASETRVISGQSKTMSYDYNLDSSLKALHYPSNRIVNYTYSAAGRALTAIDAGGQQYIGNATYWPSGATYQQWTPRVYLRTDFNKRLQLADVYSDNGSVASFYLNKTYNYGTLNNGNILSITNNKDSNRTENFTYDALNRIIAGWTNGSTGTLAWGENYPIDAWGNLEISPMGGKPVGGNWQCAADANNRANCLAYDAAGNVTANGTAHYTFDPENRLASAGGMTYTYDADGNRVEKSNGSTGTLYWYGSPGVIAQSDLNGNIQHEYVFFNGKRVARLDQPGNSLHYYLSDHLGSTSMVVSSLGAIEEESDYSPFGTEYVVTGSDSNRYKFTGKERDSESGLDYYGARYYGNTFGRFSSPDLPFADQHKENPQTWNLYMYAANNPLRNIDPNGRGVIDWVALGNSIRNWWNSGVKRDGGVANFAKNNGIGAVKGAGTFVANTTKAGVALGQAASGNIPGAFGTITTPNPKALQPSNRTQAQASTATQVVLSVATAAIPVGGAEAAATQSAATLEKAAPSIGEDVFRVWGDAAGPFGHSWTPENPDLITNFRDSAGLPDSNSGEWTSVGNLTDTTDVGVRDALPLDGNQGGLTEYTVPNPQTQIEPRYSIRNDPPK